METEEILKEVESWGNKEQVSEYLLWARRYYADIYHWQRWWCLANLMPEQRNKVWQEEKQRQCHLTPAQMCNCYNLKISEIELGKVPNWRFLIGHNIGLMANLNQELSDYENFQLIDKLLLSKSI